MNCKESEMEYDVLIIGGSFAGLSAAMALGRSLRKVLVIDSGLPCNRQTPHSHNFITHDGQSPAVIAETAKQQVLNYKTVEWINDKAMSASGQNRAFELSTQTGKTYTSKKLLFATGVNDMMPEIKGFANCWGISVLHCPYCHGYEVSGEKLAVLANGDLAFEMGKLIHHWSKDLAILTNGKSTLTVEQTGKLEMKGISIFKKEIKALEHKNGYLENVVFEDGTSEAFKAIFTRVPFHQHTDIPKAMGCEITDEGFIKVDDMQRTTTSGIYAAGDNTSPLRALSVAIATGTKAGSVMNKELIDESFS
jgi:thioredoxin reductase